MQLNLTAIRRGRSCIFLLLDEIHIQNFTLRYYLVGLINLGDISDHLSRLKHSLEKMDHTFAFMVRGLFTSMFSFLVLH